MNPRFPSSCNTKMSRCRPYWASSYNSEMSLMRNVTWSNNKRGGRCAGTLWCPNGTRRRTLERSSKFEILLRGTDCPPPHQSMPQHPSGGARTSSPVQVQSSAGLYLPKDVRRQQHRSVGRGAGRHVCQTRRESAGRGLGILRTANRGYNARAVERGRWSHMQVSRALTCTNRCARAATSVGRARGQAPRLQNVK